MITKIYERNDFKYQLEANEDGCVATVVIIDLPEKFKQQLGAYQILLPKPGFIGLNISNNVVNVNRDVINTYAYSYSSEGYPYGIKDVCGKGKTFIETLNILCEEI